MQVKRQRARRTPEYPQRELFIHHPELLRGYMPLSWKTKSALLAALFAFTACGREDPDGPGPASGGTPVVQTDGRSASGAAARTATKRQKKDTSHVAPLFAHGEARGTFGCIVVSPPVVLTEADARAVIEEALTSAGIAVDTRDVDVGGGGLLRRTPVKLDAVSKQQKVGYKVVSMRNWGEFASSFRLTASSVYEVDLVACARRARRRLPNRRDMNLAVFYTPMVRPKRLPDFERQLSKMQEKPQLERLPIGVTGPPRRTTTSSATAVRSDAITSASNLQAHYHSAMREEAANEAKALLRAQVADFVDWLAVNKRI